MPQLFAFNISTTMNAITAHGMYNVEQQVWVGYKESTARCWIGNIAISLGKNRSRADEDCRNTCRNYAPSNTTIIYSKTSGCTPTSSGNVECHWNVHTVIKQILDERQRCLCRQGIFYVYGHR